mmetsp:Transcript_19271/g.50081  ORF Transcript_19271/g.50081 Transcript_19271/m.50081 type:complete len:157 (+) Transcript_19271:675-1145(+)
MVTRVTRALAVAVTSHPSAAAVQGGIALGMNLLAQTCAPTATKRDELMAPAVAATTAVMTVAVTTTVAATTTIVIATTVIATAAAAVLTAASAAKNILMHLIHHLRQDPGSTLAKPPKAMSMMPRRDTLLARPPAEGEDLRRTTLRFCGFTVTEVV